MAIFNIRNFNPQSIRQISGLMGRAIRFTAARFASKRDPLDPRKLIYNPGTEAHHNLSIAKPTANETMKAKQFFKEHNLSGSRRCVVGAYQKDAQGKITHKHWVSVGKFRGFYWSYIKFLLPWNWGKSLDNVIKIERTAPDKLELTHGHRPTPGVIPLTDLELPSYVIQLLNKGKDTGYEILEKGKTLRIYFSEKHVEPPRSLGHYDLDISKYGLHKIIKRGKYGVYKNPDDPKDPYSLKLFSKRVRVTKRVAGPPELRGDKTPRDQEVEHGGVIKEFKSFFYLNVTLTTTSKIKIPKLNALPKDFKATVIRVRSSILFQHENNLNGKNPGDQEWFPFDKKTQHFPAEDPDQPERTTYLHFEGDPRSPYGGTGLVWGKFEMCVAPQHFAPKDPRSESQLWPWHDQGGGFFGEIKKSDDGRDWLSYPNGQIEGREAPWFMPQGTHSLQASKYISWAAIFTGSNGIERAPWINRLFLQEELEFDAPYWSQLMHFVTITEDAQGAHEKALVYDEHTFYDQESKSLASIIETINMGDRQRRRWGAMVGYFLSFAFKYLRDEIIRCRLFGILAKIPVLGIPFERARIPHVYTREQIHEWINTGTFFLDALIKYIFALTPALYIFLGFTPLPATITFIAAWLYKTMTGWPAYGYQTAKWGVSPRRTIFPFPRNIFYWYFYLPNIFRGMLHNEDEAIGAFAPTFQTRGANITSSAKKQIFWVFTALPTASAVYGLIKFYSLAFLFKTGALAAIGSSLWPLGLAIGASIIFHKLINKIWPGERTKFYQSAIKFLVPFGSILGTAIYSVAALSAAAFPGSFLLGLFMNTVWAGYMGAGALWSWWRYLKDQALIAENTDNQKVDRLKNVLREISFWDVFARDKRRMFQRGL